MNFVELEEKVITWGRDRSLYASATLITQHEKLTEENEELFQSLVFEELDEAIDAIGDMMVVLTHLAHMLGTDLTSCYLSAYEQIKDRKGKMIDGVFVKEED